MRQKRFDLPDPHIARMALAVAQDKPPHPIDVVVLRANAEVQPANTGAYLIQEPPLGRPTPGVIELCFGVPIYSYAAQSVASGANRGSP
jgi:hypothetical protein